jgi:hypothetical protein
MTPTGMPAHCPVCRASLWAPDLTAHGARDCPRCRAELWFLEFSRGPVFFVRRPGQPLADFLADLAGGRLGLGPAEFQAFLDRADCLDLVELMFEIEQALW